MSVNLPIVQGKAFPIMTGTQGIPEGMKSIPWKMIEKHEGQARRNHSQTLARLAQRGGLSPFEAVCVLHDQTERECEKYHTKISQQYAYWNNYLGTMLNQWVRDNT